jgi:two-component system cell cycle response regulator
VIGPYPSPPGGAALRPRADELAEELAEIEAVRNREVERRLAAARRIEAEALALDARSLVMRARLAQGDALQRLGQVGEGSRMVVEVNRWATEHGPRDLEARSHLIMATTFDTLGDNATALEHAVRALELLDENAPAGLRGEHLVSLANVLGSGSDFEGARRRYREAAELFAGLDDDASYLRVLNNIAYTEFEAGRPDECLRVALRMRREAGERGVRLGPAALDTLARAFLEHGRYEEAEDALHQALIEIEAGWEPAPELGAAVLVGQAETRRRMGDVDAAWALLEQAQAVVEEKQLGGVALMVQKERTAVHAAAGRYREAYEEHVRYHETAMARQAAAREAAANTRQAMFETLEARQAAQRFWEQARRDALTGLWNRRFLDEQLPALLEHAITRRQTLVLAFIDLDLFKAINDRRSHEAGDRVLTTVGELIGDVVTGLGGEAAVAARAGGEEFMVALPDVELGAALALLEAVRARVEDHDWFGLTAGIPVTASIGATTARLGDTQASAMARADARLYDAKRAGRNCVVADFAA